MKTTDKIYTIFQVVVFLVILALAFYYYGLPSIKNNFGSSDRFINEKEYNSIIEIKLSSGPEFMLITNDKKKITNLIFLNEETLTLYNRDIENHSFKDSIKKIITILQEHNYLTENTLVEMIEYSSSNHYQDIVKEFQKNTSENNITVYQIKKTLNDKLKELSITKTKDSEIKALEDYSKRLISDYKDQLLIAEYENMTILTRKSAPSYADTIYQKLEEYAVNISNQELNDTNLSIQLIPISNTSDIYPTKNSWYYIKEHKVYAYIELKDSTSVYSFCYNGEISLRKEGKCDE